MNELTLIETYDEVYRANGNAWPDFEGLIHRVFSRLVGKGDVAVDGGAHVGEYTLLFADLVGSAGRVLAFEPLPQIYPELERRVRLLTDSSVVQTYQLALADYEGSSSFVNVPELPGYSGLRERDYPWSVRTETITVRTTMLDRYLEVLNGLTLIKLDLEGGEYHALRGAAACLRRYRPYILFEHGGVPTYLRYGYSGEDFWQYLASFGYVLFDVLGNPLPDYPAFNVHKVYNFYAAWPSHPTFPRFCEIMDSIRHICRHPA